MAQNALDRFWYPVADDVRPIGRESVHSEQNMAWKIKMNGNDELRQKFVDLTVPQAEYLGLTSARRNPAVERGKGRLRLRRPGLGRVL